MKPSTYLPALSMALSFRACEVGETRRFAAAVPAMCSSAVVGLFQPCNVELAHFHQRRHDPLRLRRVLVPHHLDESGRHDLPGHAELVLEPAALPGLAALGEPVPVVV